VHKILRISLAAALISARFAGDVSAAVPQSDFDRIGEMIETENWVALRTYLTDNPELLDGNDQFADALRAFFEQTQSLYAALLFEPTIFPDPDIAEVVPDPAPLPPVSRQRAQNVAPDTSATAPARAVEAALIY